jgi:hypothetical protein
LREQESARGRAGMTHDVRYGLADRKRNHALVFRR